MENDSDIALRVFYELKSYTPIILPTLLVYAIESRFGLKLWHTVSQLPLVGEEPAKEDVENYSTAQISEICLQRRAIQKQVRKLWMSKLGMGLILFSIVAYDQFLVFYRLANPAQHGGGDDGSLLEQIESGQAMSYYLFTMLLPGTWMIARVLFLLFGLKERAVFRSVDNKPFVTFVPPQEYTPHHHLRTAATLAASFLIAIGALISRGFSICSTILLVSMIHYWISDGPVNGTISTKIFAVGSMLSVVIAFFMVHWWNSFTSFPIRALQIPTREGMRNWSELVWTTLISAVSYSYIAFGYRMDYAFAKLDGRLIAKAKDVSVPVRVRNESGETVHANLIYKRISCTPSSNCEPASPDCGLSPRSRILYHLHNRQRWPKRYFHTSVLSFFLVYILVAYFKVKGYIETDAELAGIYALYIIPPVTCFTILLRAGLKGWSEVKRVWSHKEDWTSIREDDGSSSSAAGGNDLQAGGVKEGELVGKVLISEDREEDKVSLFPLTLKVAHH